MKFDEMVNNLLMTLDGEQQAMLLEIIDKLKENAQSVLSTQAEAMSEGYRLIDALTNLSVQG